MLDTTQLTLKRDQLFSPFSFCFFLGVLHLTAMSFCYTNWNRNNLYCLSVGTFRCTEAKKSMYNRFGHYVQVFLCIKTTKTVKIMQITAGM